MIPKARYSTPEPRKLVAEFTLRGLRCCVSRDGGAVLVNLVPVFGQSNWYEIPKGLGRPDAYLIETAERHLPDGRVAVICGLGGEELEGYFPRLTTDFEGDVQATFLLSKGYMEVVASNTGKIKLCRKLIQVRHGGKVRIHSAELCSKTWDKVPKILQCYRIAIAMAVLKAECLPACLTPYATVLR